MTTIGWLPFALLFVGLNILALSLGSYWRGRVSKGFMASASLVGFSWISSAPVLILGGTSSPWMFAVALGATAGALGMARSSWQEARGH